MGAPYFRYGMLALHEYAYFNTCLLDLLICAKMFELVLRYPVLKYKALSRTQLNSVEIS
jgi:hypothetical protein